MTIDEARMFKAKLEFIIRDAVASFHHQTGMRVTDIELILRTAIAADGRTESTVYYDVRVRAEV
jgi:hypothetical protein